MPKIFEFLSYVVFMYSNENNEPVHVHVSFRQNRDDNIKIWVNYDGKTAVDEHSLDSHFYFQCKKDIGKILKHISLNYELILEKWDDHFENLEFNSKIFDKEV